MTDRDETFSADDLALLSGETVTPDPAPSASAPAAPAAAANVSVPADLAVKEAEAAAASTAPDKDVTAPAEGDKVKGADKPADGDKRPSSTILDDLDADSLESTDAKPEDKDKPDEGKDKADPDKTQKPAEGDDWRERLATSILDKVKGKIPENQAGKRRQAILNELARFKTQDDYLIAGFSARERIRSGDVRSKLPDNASEEELAAFRKENGIPEKAADYDIPKIPGYKWTENDKPLIDSFKEFAHRANYNQQQMSTAAEWYVQTVQKQADAYAESIAQTDLRDKEEVKHELRTAYGPQDFRPNIVILDRLLKDEEVFPPEVAEGLRQARYTDKNGVSRKIFNSFHLANALVDYASLRYGDGSLISGDGKPEPQDDVIEEADRILATDRDRYFREGWDQKAVQAAEEKERRAAKRGRRAS
jgi:hypothetical protein